MKNRALLPAILLGLTLSLVGPFAHPVVVLAQTQCHDNSGMIIPCPTEEERKKKPTRTPLRPTKTATPTLTFTATPPPTVTPSVVPIQTLTPEILQLLPPSSDGGGPEKQNFGFPGGFGWLFGMIIIVCFGGGLLLFREYRESPSKPPNPNSPPGPPVKPDGAGSDKMEAQPHMNPAEDGFIKLDASPNEPGGDGSDKMEAQPHMNPGGDGSDKMEAQPHMNPGGDGSDKMEAQPHMNPGEDGFIK
jgi:hypothetical protein